MEECFNNLQRLFPRVEFGKKRFKT